MKEITKSSATLERILLSAVHCYGLYGVEETSLEQVAGQAGVGRTTVYRHAKNKRELLNKVLLRDAQHALGELEVATRYYETLDAVVVESVLFLMRRRNGYEMQRILYESETGTTQGAGLSLDLLGQLAAQALQKHFEKACAGKTVPPGLTLPMLADWMGRITLSLHSQPSEFTATEENLRAYLNVVLRPIFNS